MDELDAVGGLLTYTFSWTSVWATNSSNHITPHPDHLASISIFYSPPSSSPSLAGPLHGQLDCWTVRALRSWLMDLGDPGDPGDRAIECLESEKISSSGWMLTELLKGSSSKAQRCVKSVNQSKLSRRTLGRDVATHWSLDIA